MKKLCPLILVICLFSFEAVQAQFSKGRFIVGTASTINLGGGVGSELMSLGFTSSKSKDGSGNVTATYRETSFNILPRGGYCVIDNLVVGLDVIVSTYSETEKDTKDKFSENILAIGPFARYYYPLISCIPFFEVNTAFGSEVSKYTYQSFESEDKNGLLLFGAGAGGSKLLGERVIIDGMLGYTAVIRTYKDGVDIEGGKEICGSIGIKVGFTVLLGLN